MTIGAAMCYPTEIRNPKLEILTPGCDTVSDRVTMVDRRSPGLEEETFGRGRWHGPETVPQPDSDFEFRISDFISAVGAIHRRRACRPACTGWEGYRRRGGRAGRSRAGLA